MSATTTTAPTAAGTIPMPKTAFVPRLIAAFSGTGGTLAKILLLSTFNALGVWAAYVLTDQKHWIALAVLLVTTLGVDYLFLGASKRALPLKFIVPAGLFMLAFQVVPIFYTIQVALSNYSTGHVISRGDAIRQIELTSLQPPENGKTYAMAPARNADGSVVLILQDQDTGATFVGTPDGLTPLPKSDVTTGALGITGATGYKIIKGAELFAMDAQLRGFKVPTTGDSAISPQTISTAAELEPTLRYDEKRGVFVRISDGAVFRDNGRGAFTSGAQELEPGWKSNVGFLNFSRIIHNPLIRGPFLKIFAWTFVYAVLTVFLSFGAGLLLAIALNKSGMRFQRFYRSMVLIPWAMPGFISLLVWRGLLNDDFGVVNRLFHVNIPWLFDANWAKVSVILVSFWLTVPYFFLVSMGALQSIPKELVEAAHVDGGGAAAIFRRITLPLVLVVTAPLLIASFAFNFNNFNNIYLLTGGGPTQTDQPIAGSTDILISYTYKLAIATGKGSDYALASAVSIIIFIIVATISAVSFSRSSTLENLR